MATHDNSDSLQPWIISVVSSMTALAFLAVGLRLLARYENSQRLWWDDWMILFSMAWNIIVVGFIFGMVQHGMGLHADTLEVDDLVMIAKLLVVAEILYVFNLVWTKLSFLLMYYRIFHLTYYKHWAYGIGAFIIAWVICITFLFIFICVPVEKLWYPQLPGHCINQVATWVANAVSTIVTDLIILVLPLPSVWALQLKRAEKITITFAFCLGFFVVIASAYRFKVLFSYTSTDSSYTLTPTVGWTAIEMSAGIISACLPVLKPALRFFGRHLGFSDFVTRHFTLGGSAGRSAVESSAPSHGSVHGHNSDADLVHKPGKGDFYELGEPVKQDHPPSFPAFRPDDVHCYAAASAKGAAESDSSSDKARLRGGIHIQRELRQSVE